MNNNDFENTENEQVQNTLPASDINPPVEFNGSWEKKGRSITAAAVVGMLGIGALYFNVQSILITVFIFIYESIYNITITGSNFIERVQSASGLFKTPTLIALVISQYLFMLLPVLLIVKKWHTSKIRKYIRLNSCSIKEIVLAVLITIFLIPFANYITYLLLHVFKIPEVFQDLGSEIFHANTAKEFSVMIFVVALTPAICEEIFFRGYIQRTFERTLGAKSFVITGFLFGLFHMQPLGLITLAMLGILFSFFYYRSKSLLPSSAAHFTNNLIAIGFLYFGSAAKEGGVLYEGNFPFSWIIVSFVIAAGLLAVYFRITKNSINESEKSTVTPNNMI